MAAKATERRASLSHPLLLARTVSHTPSAALALKRKARAAVLVTEYAKFSGATKLAATHSPALAVRRTNHAIRQTSADASQGIGEPLLVRSASRPAPASIATAKETRPMSFSGYRNADQSGTIW